MSSHASAESARSSTGLILVSLAGVLWGTGGLSVQLIRRHAEMSPYVISAYRTVIASVVLVVAVLVLRRMGEVRIVLRDHAIRAVAAGLGTAAYQLLYFVSVVLVGVTVSTVVSLGTAPVVLAVSSAIRHRRLPTLRLVVQLGAALVGLVLVSLSAADGAGVPGGTTHSRTLAGIVVAVAAGVGFAAATKVAEPVARQAEPLALTTVATVAGALALLPVGLLTGRPYTTSSVPASATLLYLGAATFALAYGLLYTGLRSTSSHAAVLAALFEPVTAALLAMAILGEQLTVGGMIGMVLVIAAIAAS